MKYEIIEKHFGDRTEYHVVIIKEGVITASRTFYELQAALDYKDKLENS
tara:strand:+ start:297 stop:443 length:147 start_codon:yes stop_codon:yes gene_type:complete